MRSFQSSKTFDPVPGSVVVFLRQIDRGAGTEARHAIEVPQLLIELRARARIESVTASNEIEGLIVERERITSLLSNDGVRFRNRSEAEFAGYMTALDYVYAKSPARLTVGFVCYLHRLLYSHTEGRGGSFKRADNIVMENQLDGKLSVRFTPVSAKQTPFFIGELIIRTEEFLKSGAHHPMLVIAAFALDFSCIHPFADGNGRIARLVTTYLMERAGYGIGRYISLEQLILNSKDDYYASLHHSTSKWFDNGQHQIWPWAQFLLGQTAEAYRLYESRIDYATKGGSKQDRVRRWVLKIAPNKFSMDDVRRALPGMSDNTLRLVLQAMRDEKLIRVDGLGRTATWIKIR